MVDVLMFRDGDEEYYLRVIDEDDDEGIRVVVRELCPCCGSAKMTRAVSIERFLEEYRGTIMQPDVFLGFVRNLVRGIMKLC